MSADVATEVQVPSVTAPVVEPKTDAPAADATQKSAKTRKPRRRAPKAPKSADGTAAENKQQEEEDHTHKVFVGNLAFATTEEELKEFGSPAGEVLKVEIILRGTRSLGYGFVSFNTEEEAAKAVTLLDKKELGGRQVNVENARLRQTGEKKPSGTRARRGRGRGYLGRGRSAASGDEKRVDDEPENGEAPAEGDKTARRRRPARRAPRAEGEPRPEVTGDLSDTGLFVANLPFKVTDDDLKAIFKDYKVTKARVVRLRSGRSKGFGFVEVDSKGEQDRIVNELKNIVVEGRELVIKVALANQTAPEGAAAAEESAVAAA